jgi:hypothetical protein
LCKDAYKIALQFFRSGFYGLAGGGGTPEKPAYSLPKGSLPGYNGRGFRIRRAGLPYFASAQLRRAISWPGFLRLCRKKCARMITVFILEPSRL